MTYLALDLGVRTVTAAVWSPSGLHAVARSSIAVGAGPRDWWSAVETAVSALDTDLVEVEAVGCAGAAETAVLLARDGKPLRVLSVADLRAADLSGVGWIAGGRDFLASLLTGRLASDPTAASATGLFRPDGTLDVAAVAAAGIEPEWLPPQRGSTDVLGDLLLPAARRLGLRSRIPVVMGATSEACAVEGIGALPVAPLVRYGRQVVVAVPVEPPVVRVPDGVALRAGGRSYQVLEAVLPDASVDAIARVVASLAPEAQILWAAGDPSTSWLTALATVTRLPVARRRSGEPATLGLAMLTATGIGAHLDRDAADPVTSVELPDAAAIPP